MAKEFKCHYCGKVLSSKQMLEGHLKRKNPCYGAKKELQLKTTVRIGPSYHYVGFDPDDDTYYYDIVKEERIKVPLSINLALNDIITLYNRINRLDNQDFGSLIQRITLQNERPGFPNGGLFNYYEYMNRGGDVELHEGGKDLIRLIWDQLMSCFVYEISDAIGNYIHNRDIEEDEDNLDQQIKRRQDQLGTPDQLILERFFKQNGISWTEFLTNYIDRDQRKIQIAKIVEQIFYDSRPKLKVLNELNLDTDLIPISRHIYKLADSNDIFEQFKAYLLP